MAKLTLSDITGGAGTAALHNSNYALIEAALENTLSRDGTTPNMMDADIDMNSNDINNAAIMRTTRLFIDGNEAHIRPDATIRFDNGSITDLTITSVADGEILQYDSVSSEWINQTLAEAGISAVGHTHVEADITDLGSYLLDTTDTFVGTLTIEDDLVLSGSVPLVLWGQTDAGIDQKYWGAYALSEAFSQVLWSDSFVNSYTWLSVTRSGTGSGVQADIISLAAESKVVINSQTLDIGLNGGGDSVIQFYDDTNNTQRSIFWDDSESAFFFEKDDGTFAQFGTGTGGSDFMLMGG